MKFNYPMSTTTWLQCNASAPATCNVYCNLLVGHYYGCIYYLILFHLFFDSCSNVLIHVYSTINDREILDIAYWLVFFVYFLLSTALIISPSVMSFITISIAYDLMTNTLLYLIILLQLAQCAISPRIYNALPIAFVYYTLLISILLRPLQNEKYPKSL